jgi:hypothetical protein
VLAVALVALAGAGVARAGTDTFQDTDDQRGPLDISSVEQGHAGGNVTHTITTYEAWPGSLLARRTANFLLIEINTDADRAPERNVLIVMARGRLIAAVLDQQARQLLGRASVSRPDRHAVEFSIRPGLLGNPAGYRWRVLAFFEGERMCRRGCLDRAPNGTRVVHDLRAPFISFPQPPSPAQTLDYNVVFTVRDAGGSGLAFWRLEQRIEDSGAAWNTVGEGATIGLQAVLFTAGMPAESDQFRIIAEDEHGNQRISPLRTVVAGS